MNINVCLCKGIHVELHLLISGKLSGSLTSVSNYPDSKAAYKHMTLDIAKPILCYRSNLFSLSSAKGPDIDSAIAANRPGSPVWNITGFNRTSA